MAGIHIPSSPSSPLAQARHIVVEGPIGAGKSTLARRLAEHLNARPVLEDPEANPFLGRFYQDRHRYALPTQLHFLLKRHDQLAELQEHLLPAEATPVVCDFLADKDALFARINLSDEELALYQRLSERTPLPQVTPDLVIFLQAAPENLIARVRRRASASERTVDDTYLVRLADAYSHFAYHYDACPVMIVNSDNLNFADRDDDFHLLLERLGQQRSHREFFNLGG